MSNLKPILHKLLFHLTPKGRLNWDPTGKVGSSPLTPFDCQQSLWHPPTPPGTSSVPLEPLWAPALLGAKLCQAGPGWRWEQPAGCSSTGGMWGSPKHPDPTSPQCHSCMWLCDGCGVGPSPTLSLWSVPGHMAASPSKHNKEWKKNESNSKSRLGPPCCRHLNQGREQPVPPFQLGTVGWGRNGERKQNSKQQLSNNCFLQYVQSPAGRASPYSSPQGRVRHEHTQLRPMALMSPGQAAGEAGGEQGQPGR